MARSSLHPRSGHSVFCRVCAVLPDVGTRRPGGFPFGDRMALGCCLLWSSSFLRFSLALGQHPVQGCVPGSGSSMVEMGFVRCP